ncbi:transmembrane protein 94 isoform X2 [Planococcus citri]|uniref:transmembrane protein 94 isoform X2 n=1 Tax=Planococcus citri TaxID=170843 RepID=UPI0031F747D2
MISNDDGYATEADHPLLSKHEGLSTKQALSNLHDEIKLFLNAHRTRKLDLLQIRKNVRESFSYLNYYSTLSCVPIAILISFIIAFFVFGLSKYTILLLFFLLVVNFGVVFWDHYLRMNEFNTRIVYILKLLKKTERKNDWHADLLPNLYTPHSPSVSLQWTIRDGHLVNLPAVLLAKDDIIVMRPGQQSPAQAEALEPSENGSYETLQPDQLFACGAGGSENVDANDSYQSIIREPFQDRVFKVKQAPYISQLNSIKDKYLKRPTSLYNKARYLLFGKCIHHVSLPLFCILGVALAIIRGCMTPVLQCPFENCSKFQYIMCSFVSEIGTTVISLVSLIFPVYWFIANNVGNAAVLSCQSLLENEENRIKVQNKLFENLKESTENPYFIDVEASPRKSPKERRTERWCSFRKHFIDMIANKGVVVAHSTNFLHTMASVSVLCCVDKKGILSWPNPTAEKVFFLKNGINHKNRRSASEMSGPSFRSFSSPATASDSPDDAHESHEPQDNKDNPKNPNDTHIEVFSKTFPYVEILDITPRDDTESAWKIEFDDSRWRTHLASLKPVGLAILLNTCNRYTHDSYSQFCAHITNYALFSQHLVPVGNRRCLCELARQIGFNQGAVEKAFNLDIQLFSYNNLKTSQADNKYVQAFFKTRKPKFPFPHSMSAVVNTDKNKKVKLSTSMKEKRKKVALKYKEKQMFSQGTADVILDYCIDYWDGQDVLPLTPGLRKKILDFYQRSSLTAYCTAFSYRPVYKNFEIDRSSDQSPISVYLELIKTSEHRQNQKRRRRRKKRHQQELDSDIRKKLTIHEVNECEEEPEPNTEVDQEENNLVEEVDCYDYYDDDDDDEDEDYDDYYSGYDEIFEEDRCKQPERQFRRSDTVLSADDSMGYFKVLNKQIFLGMVSMQYQPLHDMVTMVEELEKACIRFVHFSKENELRSRVFSEKMGLESGWNCHISLLSEADINQQPSDNTSGTENVSVVQDPESVIETGASSADDEEKVPFAFDMSNRAKLPCGIRNIKPHLEQVDNVPLLVSLFTDCTADTTEQMLSIMQEYDQVVCVLGSSANVKNFTLFAQADASISIEPLYAQVCQKIPPSSGPYGDVKELVCLSPVELSQVLNSLPCSLILQRPYGSHRALPIHPVIAESRNIMHLIWNSSQFWACSIALTAFVQLFVLFLLLPAIFTLEQSLWISCVVIPCLSIALVSAPYDEEIMSKAIGKDWLCSVNWTTISYSLYCYGVKLLCGIIFAILAYFMVLIDMRDCFIEHTINTTSLVNDSVPANTLVYNAFVEEIEETQRFQYFESLNLIQCYMTIIVTLHLIALSCSFLYRDSVFWRKLPCLNLLWSVVVMFPISLQIAHFFMMINGLSIEDELASCILYESLFSVKNSLFSFTPPLLSYAVCEFVKIYEIRSNERYQKKMRLEFGTKLGMNSPF